MSRRVRAAIVAAAVTLAITPAAVAKPVDDEAETVEQNLAEATRTDLALVAQARGWTIEQARAHQEMADRMGRVQEAVALRMPDRYSGGVLSDIPGGVPTLLLKGDADGSIQDIVASAGIPIRVVGGQPYSFVELEQRSRRVHKQLAELGYRDVATAVDVASARVVATIAIQDGLPASAATLSAALPDDLTADLDLTVVSGPVGGDLRAFGGMAVQDDGAFECTGGWSVRNNTTGVLGVTTAGHCDGINQLVDPQGSLPDLVQPFPLQQQHRGQWGDVEWHTSPSATPDNFFFSADNTIRQVSSLEPRASISVGESVCVYGRSSNSRDCSMTVFLTSVSCTVSGVSNDRLVAMNTVRTIIGGDSGGPWSMDFRAYGSTKGFCTFSGAARAVWSVADLYDEALGVTVLTN